MGAIIASTSEDHAAPVGGVFTAQSLAPGKVSEVAAVVTAVPPWEPGLGTIFAPRIWGAIPVSAFHVSNHSHLSIVSNDNESLLFPCRQLHL